MPTTDYSGLTGITMFDFNQDGKQELVYRDETTLRIIEGATGATLASYPLKSGTWLEYPVVADVDNDGQAKILVNGYEDDNNIQVKIYCFETAGAPWAPARSVWNQYGYHVTNVNDDLTIPRQEQNMAMPLEGYGDCLQPTCPAPYNAFMAQATYRTQQGCVQFPAVDLQLQALDYNCSPDSLYFQLAIANLSETALAANCVNISYYSADPSTGPAPIGTFCQPLVGAAGSLDTISLALALPAGLVQVYFVVNDPGTGANADNYAATGIIECDYTNNTAAVPLQLDVLTLDLGPDRIKCQSEVVTFHAGGGFETYLWDDGTVDSIFSTSFAGLHYVEATDHCHRAYRDSVTITIDNTTDVELGPDLTACPGDTVSLSLVGDYDQVQWLSTQSLNCDTCLSVAVASDSSYSLMVVVGKASCFSADTVQVQVLPQVILQETQTICQGETLDFMGGQFSLAGQYVLSLNGCDSTAILDLQVNPTDSLVLQASICMGDSVLFDGSHRKDAGLYTAQLTNVLGCDSLVILDLSITNGFSTVQTVSVCPGDSINVMGQWVMAGTSVSNTFSTAAGCDSTVTVNVVALPTSASSLSLEACPGSFAMYNGQQLPTGSTTDVIFQNYLGCDSTVMVTVNPLPTSAFSLSLETCPGSFAVYNGQQLPTGSTTDVIFQNYLGCDSTVTVTVNPLPAPTSWLALSACANGFAVYNGQQLMPGSSTGFLFASAQNCDSVVTVTVTALPTSADTLNLSACQGSTTSYNGVDIPAGGQQVFNLTNYLDCDSTVTVLVEPLPVNVQQVDAVACANSFFEYNGQLLLPGTQTIFTEPNQWGCTDSAIVTVTALPVDASSLSLIACPGQSVTYNGTPLFPGDVQDFTLTNQLNCDSVVTVTVLSLQSDTTQLALQVCVGEMVDYLGQQLSAGDQYTWVGTNQQDCDSVVLVTVSAWPIVAFDLVASQICWNDADGSISIKNLNGSTPPYEFSLDGSSYQLDTAFAALPPGDYTVYLRDQHGCVFKENASVQAIPPIMAEAQDETLVCGETVLLRPLVASNLPLSWEWSDSTGLLSTSPELLVGRPGIYAFAVSNDCETVSKEIKVKQAAVPMEDVIYLPNSFSPNGDGINDCYRGYLAPDMEVLDYELSLFDRWGEQLFLTHEVEGCWDGSFRDKLMDITVMVCWVRLQVRNCDGRVLDLVRKGEVHLMR
ncbi:MAG: gliding motility-associated C-terminal domain-containing protein [Saprospiraceae bacterium]|nr:gliding motility-associated C-terminal domain-containing protein [Saprospiraceae bacterium]MCF8252814.1 gliding motility-associated C-terminal domain-containing protein [Saprospiraceae bacterium]MCF8283255.1 gliding motility-associated C-terminal domain-containing protein [Bacteroidales bacterium]MCF8314370.1 gliding motility-associated C-terminal domain-containing protein [Saprospiraceae bacterium]MCF8443241.1 gliding motility-associated C-terminal domain-containing protein [Saprospiraceae 